MQPVITSDIKYKYAFALHRNSRAFIESVVNYAQTGYRDEWKFAILHLATALELLLKARLAIEGHRHLVAGKTAISDRQFDEGDFRSLGIDECCKKLERISRFSLSSHQRQVLSTVGNLRNRVAHYIEPPDTAVLRAVVAAGFNLFIDIDSAEFRNEDPSGAKTISQLVVELHKFEDFVKERLALLADQLRSATRPRTHHADECSHCLQDAAIIDNDDLRCLFCGDTITFREFAQLRSDDWSVEVCPECGRESVLMNQWKDREPTHECFCCGYFRGQELKWSDGENEIPRLHADR